MATNLLMWVDYGGYRTEAAVPDYLQPSDHGNKEVRKALAAIFASGEPGEWCIVKGAHWGTLRCRQGCCSHAISGTPKNPTNFARRLEREARRHPRADDDPRNKRRD